jgi:hypothetical protein
METQLIERPRYVPSGRVDLVAIGPSLVFVAAVALLIAAALEGLIQVGGMPLGITCLMPGFLLGFATAFAVRRAHCRNRAVGLVLGVCAAFITLGGYYHLDQCLRWDVPWQRLDRLPGFVVYRLETDRVEFEQKWFVVRPAPAQPGVDPVRPIRLQPSWAFLGLLSDLLMLAIIPAILGYNAASAPYSENARRWLVSESLTLVPEEGARLLDALANEGMEDWARHEPRRIAAHQPHCRLKVWYCPARGESIEAEVYLTVGKTKLMRLSPDEAAHLTLLVPGLADLAGPTFDVLAAESASSTDPAAARVWPVPGSESGRLVSRTTQSIASSIHIFCCLTPLIGIGVIVAGIGVFQQVFAPNNVPAAVLISWTLLAGLVTLALTGLVFRRNFALPGRVARQFILARLRRGLAERSDVIVKTDDVWAVLVEMQPRRNFGAKGADRLPTEYGLLTTDFDQRLILFEGDQNRYQFPAAAILGCTVDTFTEASPTTASDYYVVVRVRLGGGLWEFPFRPHALIDGNNNWERAETLRSRVEFVTQKYSPHEPPPPPPPPIHVVV